MRTIDKKAALNASPNPVGGIGGGYDTLEPNGRRKSISRRVVREDALTRGTKRDGLQANASDLARNLSLAGWMVRRHLDYVATFTFHGRNEDQNLNLALENLMKTANRKTNADVAQKFTREKLFRLAETRRVLDGDTFLLKLSSMKMQGLQADLCRNPERPAKNETWINGVSIAKTAQALAFGVYDREGYQGTRFNRRVRARNMIHYGFFERYAQDQVRGVSPIVAALNPLRDTYENFDFALAKAKISQLFALAFYQEGDQSPLRIQNRPGTDEPADEDGDHVAEERGFYTFTKSDLMFTDLEPNEKVEILESKTPSRELQDFTQLVIMVALKALDIPYSFYDESHTNFFGSRAAWLHYERSCMDKRADQLEMRRDYTEWQLAGAVLDGSLVLPPGMTIQDLQWEWVPRGMPWWDPSKEINGHVQAIDGALDNPQRICTSTGTDFYDNVDKIAQAQEYAAAKGVDLSWNPVPQPIQVVENDDRNAAS